MIKLEETKVLNWEAAIRGMRNPMNSWDKSDSEPGCEIVTGSHEVCRECDHAIFIQGNLVCGNGRQPEYVIGFNDRDLMIRLAKAGTDHAKYRRQIIVSVDITAPLYWWKEFDTYKVGTVANSCSTMHKIHARPLVMADFSTDHLLEPAKEVLRDTITVINKCRDLYLGCAGFKYEYSEADKKEYWYNMIQLLPSSYNQKRTITMNYENLANMYKSRKNHKLDEWHVLCDWIKELPYSEVITLEEKE